MADDATRGRGYPKNGALMLLAARALETCSGTSRFFQGVRGESFDFEPYGIGLKDVSISL